MALTADFPNITIVGNAANSVLVTQDWLDEIHEVENVYSDLMYKHYGTSFPLWDETAAAVMLEPSLVTNSTKFYLDVDTSFASPSYGNIHAYQEALAPTVQNLREINMIVSVNGTRVRDLVKESVQYPKTCSDWQ